MKHPVSTHLPRAAARPPYVRPMHGWWKRDPFFMRYMVRELTAFAVLAYAVVLAVGVVRLAQGEAAWNGWVAALRSPASLLLHAVLLVAFVVHAKSWFEIMPKTMPTMFVGGRRVPGTLVTRTGWAATVVASLVVLALAAWGVA
jgi:fumarate reductase subunit C